MGAIGKIMKKIIVVVGPTASGKTSLSIKLAKRFNGEIISADSRQVYKGMDIGTGKVTKKEMKGIPHHLLDVVSPKTRFDITKYRKLADQATKEIFKKGKVPIIVGGTGFYVQAITDGIIIPEVKPDWKLREKLNKKTAEKLFEILENKDPERAKNIDCCNKRRLIRALEIVLKTKKAVPPIGFRKPDFDILMLGVSRSKTELNTLIYKRLIARLDDGMIGEVKKLHKSGVSFRRLEEFGLEYRYLALYLQGKLQYDEMVEKLDEEIEHYAKRQMTWFKKDKRIKWVKDYEKAAKLTANFLK